MVENRWQNVGEEKDNHEKNVAEAVEHIHKANGRIGQLAKSLSWSSYL